MFSSVKRGTSWPTAQVCGDPVNESEEAWLGRSLPGGILVPSGEGNLPSPVRPRPSPVQDPDLVAAGQGCPQFVGLVYQRGISELLPHEVPLLLPTLGDGVAVDSGAQVGVDPGERGGGWSGVGQEQGGWDEGLMRSWLWA